MALVELQPWGTEEMGLAQAAKLRASFTSSFQLVLFPLLLNDTALRDADSTGTMPGVCSGYCELHWF